MTLHPFEITADVDAHGLPCVHVRWGAMHGVLSPVEARHHALVMLELAETSESDAAARRCLITDLGLSPAAADLTVAAMHTYRQQQ